MLKPRTSALQRMIFEALKTRARRRTPPWFRYRRALLRGALREDGYTLPDFAAKMSITHTHLNFVLRGLRPSTRIDKAACLLITYVYGDRIGSRYAKKEPTNVKRWGDDRPAVDKHVRRVLRKGIAA